MKFLGYASASTSSFTHFIDNARVGERELASEELLVVVRTQLAQQSLADDVGARIGAVADPLPDRRDIRGLRLLHQIEKRRLRQLTVGWKHHAELLQLLLVVIEFVGVGLLRHTVGLAIMHP